MSKKTKPEAEEQEQVKTEAPAEETAKADAKPATDWEAKYNDLNDRYLRMAAEYDNFRKRSRAGVHRCSQPRRNRTAADLR